MRKSLALAVLAIATLQPSSFAQSRDIAPPAVTVSGETKLWHKVTLSISGPTARESDSSPNPFTDYEVTGVFRHAESGTEYRVPGYFAADGHAAESSAESGNVWRIHFSPDRIGRWDYAIDFQQNGGDNAVTGDGLSGQFSVSDSDKSGRDLRSKGRLEYVGGRYLRFAGTGEVYLKFGADAPETLLAYDDFDNTEARSPKKSPLKSWSPHAQDWRPGDPQWQGERGRELIGAINYLSEQGCNAFSFLTYNAGGDGDNVWPMVSRDDRLHYDCSKLDQWQIVFDHAVTRGMFLHFKLQETENDDNRKGDKKDAGEVETALDGGQLGPERKLYLREMVARYAYLPALNWNLGEENTQSTDEVLAMCEYLRQIDPYHHPIVLHTYPSQQEHVYTPLLGRENGLHGLSLQNGWDAVHRQTLQWVQKSQAAGYPWVVCNDEQNPAGLGVPPDPGYEGFDGIARNRSNAKAGDEAGGTGYDLHDIRTHTLWGNLMAGGGGVEYYFGYQLPQNDLVCEDFRSRQQSWNYGRIALEFFDRASLDLPSMQPADELLRNRGQEGVGYVLAQPSVAYLVYRTGEQPLKLDLSKGAGRYRLRWYDPRNGGEMQTGSIESVEGGSVVDCGQPPSESAADWLVLLESM